MKCLVFFLANNLLAPNQSGFKPGDTCINHLLSIRSDLLDISKAFNKVWHEGLIFTLQ